MRVKFITWVTERLTSRSTGRSVVSTANLMLLSLVENFVERASRFGKFRGFDAKFGSDSEGRRVGGPTQLLEVHDR
jgi:hypothetical protein